MPSWLKGQITREECEAFVHPYDNGKFCIRERPDFPSEYVLCVVYKGKPTHHLITTAGGVVTVNKKKYGGATTLPELVGCLSKPGVAGWPVQLVLPEGDEKGDESSSESSHTVSRTPTKKGAARWLHNSISKEDSEALLIPSPAEDGKFLVRKRDGQQGQYVLSVIFKGKPIHRLIEPNEAGILCVNKIQYTGAKNIKTLVKHISSNPPPPKWPVRLTMGVSKSGETFPFFAGNEGGSNSPWLHPFMSNNAAEGLLAGKEGQMGAFLIRKHSASGKFVITVIYKGKPTHHLCVAIEGSISTVSGKETGVKGIVATIDLLRNKQPFWPVALTEFIPGPDAGGSDRSAAVDNSAAERNAANQQQKEDDAAQNQRKQEQADAAAKQEEAEAESKRQAEEEADAKRKAEEEEAAAKQIEEEQAAAKQVEEEEDKKVTGFPTLANPFPSSNDAATSGTEDNNGYMTVGPTAQDLLTQARMIAMATASGLSPELKTKYNVGKLIQLSSDPSGSTSTDDYMVASGSYSTPNPYMTNSGLAGTSAGARKLTELEEVVVDIDARVRSGGERLGALEEYIDALPEVLTLRQEVLDLRSKNVSLEKKLIMLEHLIMRTGPGDDSEAAIVSLIDVRQIVKENKGNANAGGRGGGDKAGSLERTDLANTKLLGKIAVPRGTVYQEMRDMIFEQFDDDHIPKDFKFYMVDIESPELLLVHTKQESKVPLEEDLSVVYIHTAVAAKAQDTGRRW